MEVAHVPDPNGFLRYERQLPARRPVPVRIMDWREVYPPAGRRADPRAGHPLHGLRHPVLPRRLPAGQPHPGLERPGPHRRVGRRAVESLHATNNFPEFTGRLCPAPCEAACVLGIAGGDPVTIKQVEVEITNRAFDRGHGRRRSPARRRPAGGSPWSAPARPGWPPRSSWPGPGTRSPSTSATTRSAGCCATASPTSSWRSSHIDRRLAQLRAEGVRVRDRLSTSASTSPATSCAPSTTRCCWPAARWPAGTPRRRRAAQLAGVHLAMEHLVGVQPGASPACSTPPPIDAAGKHVVIIGGGDTGRRLPGRRPPAGRGQRHPARHLPAAARRRATRTATRGRPGRGSCATTRRTRRAASASSPSPCRSSSTTATGAGAGGPDRRGRGRRSATGAGVVDVVPGTERELPADLVLLAIGFDGTEHAPLLDQFGVDAQPARRDRLRRRTGRPTPPACSWPATCTAARR